MKPDSSDTVADFHGAQLGVTYAVWHGLFWLVFANTVGVMIAILLLIPRLNSLLGEWTYGRWIIVHMNLELYGWTSLPMVGFLFKVYGADREPFAQWRRPVLWVWSAALGVGVLSWLTGHSSGKLFLDWTGYARIVFPLAMIALWILLAVSYLFDWSHEVNRRIVSRIAKILGLALLLAIPVMLYIASSQNLYPPVNPDTGGPTGSSQLESSLIIVAILLILPFGITQRKATRSNAISISWAVMIAESVLCASLGRTDISHHLPGQFMSLGSLVVWIPLIPFYYSAFEWNANTRLWRNAFLCWWAVLVITGWILFLPGVLDHFKFTDGLVGHSFVAMAGFTSSLLIFVVAQLLGNDAWIFNRPRSFYIWHASVLAYIVLMTIAGWHEGFDPTFTIVAGSTRNVLYMLRLLVGVLMLVASLDWFADASKLLRDTSAATIHVTQEIPA